MWHNFLYYNIPVIFTLGNGIPGILGLEKVRDCQPEVEWVTHEWNHVMDNKFSNQMQLHRQKFLNGRLIDFSVIIYCLFWNLEIKVFKISHSLLFLCNNHNTKVKISISISNSQYIPVEMIDSNWNTIKLNENIENFVSYDTVCKETFCKF